jgi:hypothetical protein
MNDNWISPDHRPALPVPRAPGEALWVLSKDHRIISCELRDESRSGAGFDLVIRQDGELSFSRRCADEAGARYVANALLTDHTGAGWTEKGDA